MTSDNSAKIFGKPLVSQYGGFAGFCWCISLARLNFSFLPVILTLTPHIQGPLIAFCVMVETSSLGCFMAVCEEARTTAFGFRPNSHFHFPPSPDPSPSPQRRATERNSSNQSDLKFN